ncbi:MAG: hypothetical protein M3N49_01605 [Candidatus Eremiobacteraeota bacterium]|nr:hypothetical protein [Candidatus Eremiobacteraeota bacterium]
MSESLSVLLGAGFSQGAGLPGTVRLTEEIIARAEPSDVSLKMWETLREFDPESNFETMFHAIETLYSIKGTRAESTTRAMAAAFAQLRACWDGITGDQLREYYGSCLAVLHSTLSASIDGFAAGEPEGTARMLRSFIASFRVRVFDLNYDDIGEHIAGNIRDGFPPGGAATPFDYDDLRAEDERVEWCHLHGSLRYEMRLPPPRAPEILKHPSREAAAATFANALLVMAQDGEVAAQAAIISGLRKLGNALFEPFPVYYHRFVSALLDCPRLLIVGYGGGDTHISQRLWQWRRVHGHRARLVWVTRRLDRREPCRDLFFPQYAAGTGGFADVSFTVDDIVRGEYRTANAYVVFTGSPLCEDATDRAIDFLNSNA